jgi:glucosamine-6-phosphate deaminase
MKIEILPTRAALGIAAASAIAAFLKNHTPLAAMFAAAPSQTETLEALVKMPGIDWQKIQAFHLDEYSGATPDCSYSFRRYLIDTVFSRVPVASFEGLRGESADLEAERIRYSTALAAANPTVAFIGIGENGHLAFNDPPAARFDDPDAVRIVQLTESCRQQQVHDKTFPNLEAVPLAALSVTIPRLMQIPHLFVMVPGIRKAEAVRTALEGPIAEACPASILRRHPDVTLFLDADSASLLRPGFAILAK